MSGVVDGGAQSFRKKMVVIEAIQLVAPLDVEMFAKFMGDAAYSYDDAAVYIDTREGTMRADVGDWIIKEPFPTADRTFYPCKPDIFEATYEPV